MQRVSSTCGPVELVLAVGFFAACLTIIAGYVAPSLTFHFASDQLDDIKNLSLLVINFFSRRPGEHFARVNSIVTLLKTRFH